jgi:hypothetical protein
MSLKYFKFTFDNIDSETSWDVHTLMKNSTTNEGKLYSVVYSTNGIPLTYQVSKNILVQVAKNLFKDNRSYHRQNAQLLKVELNVYGPSDLEDKMNSVSTPTFQKLKRRLSVQIK